MLSTISDELKGKYQHDNMMQSNQDIMSECHSVYDYQESMLKLPIYEGLEKSSETGAQFQERERDHKNSNS